MYVRNALLLSAAAAAPALAGTPTMNVYWGQTGIEDLSSFCDSDGFEYVTVSFLSASPESDPDTNYPTSNFGAHCSADVYTVGGKSSRLLSACTAMQQDIAYCKGKGKKVLLSIGGVYGSDAAHNYDVSSKANGEYFAEFLWKAFGPHDPTWTGPRPFDISSSEHNVLDGFDFDIETKFADQTGYVALINKLHEYIDAEGSGQVITGAPQCPLGDQWFQMKYMIQHAKFDKLWIQFYNNPSCDGTTSGFNFADWNDFLTGTASEGAELYIGLPADASINGYLTNTEVNAIVDKYKNKPYFGGVMLWDASLGLANKVGGKAYYEAIHDYMCGPAHTTSTSSSSHTSTTSSSSSTSSSIYTTSSSSSVYTTSASHVYTTTTFTYYNTSSASSSAPTTFPASSTPSYPASSTFPASSSPSYTSSSLSSTFPASSTPSYSASSTFYASSSSAPIHSSSSSKWYYANTSTTTTAPSSSYAVSSSQPSYPTTTSYDPGYPVSSKNPGYPVSSKYPSYPVSSKDPISSTTCTDSASASIPVKGNPYPTGKPSYTTSTYVATTTYTVTACKAHAKNCNVGDVTSAVYTTTTVCPYEEAGKGQPPYPTKPAGYPAGGESHTYPTPPAKVPVYPSYPQKDESTTTTLMTSTIYSTIVVPKSSSTPYSVPTYPVGTAPYKSAGSTPVAVNTNTYPATYPAGSTGTPSPAKGCTGYGCEQVVTAGAGRAGVVALPALLAAAAALFVL